MLRSQNPKLGKKEPTMLPFRLQRLLRILRICYPCPQPLRSSILIMHRNSRRPRFKHLCRIDKTRQLSSSSSSSSSSVTQAGGSGNLWWGKGQTTHLPPLPPLLPNILFHGFKRLHPLRELLFQFRPIVFLKPDLRIHSRVIDVAVPHRSAG